MRQFVQRAANSIGVDILSLSYSREFIYGHHIKEMLARHEIETVFDVGANVGDFGKLLRKLGFSGQIVSFEPVAEPYARIKALADRDPNWTVHNFALGERAETKTINVMAGTELCSFLSPTRTSQRMTVVDSREIEVRTLDSMVTNWSRTFVKIDTQGHDMAVMRGGAGVLNGVPLIQSEVSFLQIYEGMPTFAESIGHLNSIGFDVTGLFPVSRDEHGRVREFDCVAVNRHHLPQ